MPANCDISPITLDLSSGGATVTIDGNTLIPSPFVSLQLEKYKVDTTIIGGLLRVTLSGTIVNSSFNDTTSEVINILNIAQNLTVLMLLYNVVILLLMDGVVLLMFNLIKETSHHGLILFRIL